MNFLVFLYNEIIYRPLFNLLVLLYNIIPGNDIGVAIIVLTFLVRVALYRVNEKSIESQKQMQEIQPKIKEIQEKYKDDKEKQAKALMEFYQKEKINPFSGCMPLLIQFPILIALYHVFLNGLKDESLSILYPFVKNPIHINPMFLGVINLSERNVYLAFAAGALQYLQTKMLMKSKNEKKEENEKKDEKEKTAEEKTKDFAQEMTKQMVYVMPVITVAFAMSFPSGLALYWIVTTIFAIIQQYIIIKKENLGKKEEKDKI